MSAYIMTWCEFICKVIFTLAKLQLMKPKLYKDILSTVMHAEDL